jgi:hypothetical protein
MVGLLTPAVVDQSARMPGGLLAKSLPAPDGWQNGGLVIQFTDCGEPVLRDKCVDDEDIPNRLAVREFPSFPLESGVMCSTTGRDSISQAAFDAFAATADWSLTRQLQSDPAATGAPTLDDSTLVGTYAAAAFVQAVGCLEQAAADAGFGQAWMLHTTLRGAAYLEDNLSSSVSPSGAPIVVGSGYTNLNATTVPIWATSRVYASISEPDGMEGVGYRVNNLEAWARGEGIVAFNDCINLRVHVTVPTC